MLDASPTMADEYFFNHPATTGIYTLSLHGARPICRLSPARTFAVCARRSAHVHSPAPRPSPSKRIAVSRSEEHTSELQSRQYLVCRLLLEKKKNALFHLTPLYFVNPIHIYPNPTFL